MFLRIITIYVVFSVFRLTSADYYPSFSGSATTWSEDVQLAINEADERFSRDVRQHFKASRSTSLLPESFDCLSNVTLRHSEFVRQDGSSFVFTDPAISEMCPVHVKLFSPNLTQSTAEVEAYWSGVTIIGRYKSSTDSHDHVNLKVSFGGIKCQATVGISTEDSYMKVSNVRASFAITSVTFQKMNRNGLEETLQDFEGQEGVVDIFDGYFEYDIRPLLKTQLRTALDTVLSSYKVEDVFNRNQRVLSQYRSQVQRSNFFIDQLVDLLLMLYKNYLNLNDLNRQKAPDITNNFSQTIFGVPIEGNVIVSDGVIGDLSSIQRTGPFSLKGSIYDDEFVLFGSVGFSVIYVNYSHFEAHLGSLDVSGNVNATVGKNSIYFEVTGSLNDTRALKVISYKFSVDELEDVKVKVNGIGEGIDWLLSKIINWAIESFKPNLIASATKNARRLIDRQLDKMGWSVPLMP